MSYALTVIALAETFIVVSVTYPASYCLRRAAISANTF